MGARPVGLYRKLIAPQDVQPGRWLIVKSGAVVNREGDLAEVRSPFELCKVLRAEQPLSEGRLVTVEFLFCDR